MSLRDTRSFKMHTRMREICIEVMRDLVQDLRCIDKRYDWMENYELLRNDWRQWKENDRKYLIRSLKMWGEWSLYHKAELDKLKRNG